MDYSYISNEGQEKSKGLEDNGLGEIKDREPLKPGADGKIHGVITYEKMIIERGGRKHEVLATIERF